MRPLGIYIHVPFCLKKCKYCDFLSFSDKYSFVAEYFRVLTEELKTYEYLSDEFVVDTVFFGGGTPSSVDSKWICLFMEAVRKNFNLSGESEITIEMNPGTVNEEKLSDYLSAGINRYSLGVQTFNDKSLNRIGRIHNSDQVFKTIQMIQSFGIRNYNIDMMHALPFQTFSELCQDLKAVVSMTPAHISYYSLIIEEETEFFSMYESKPEIFPSEEEDRRMSHYIFEFLKNNGYEQYEISNYSKKGMQCRHNLKYWSLEDYLGLGLGSSSFVNGIRWKNTLDWKSYLDFETQNVIFDLEVLTVGERMEDYCIFSLRMKRGIDKRRFQRLFHKPIESVYGEVIRELIDDGLMQQNDQYLYLTRRGFDLSNLCEVKFLLLK